MKKSFFALFFALSFLSAFAQQAQPRMFSLEKADSLHKKRLYTAASIGVVGYAGALIGLNNAWYADYPRGKFHLFNDNHEWNQMDKMGHWFTTYQDARLVASTARWMGISQKKSSLDWLWRRSTFSNFF